MIPVRCFHCNAPLGEISGAGPDFIATCNRCFIEERRRMIRSISQVMLLADQVKDKLTLPAPSATAPGPITAISFCNKTGTISIVASRN